MNKRKILSAIITMSLLISLIPCGNAQAAVKLSEKKKTITVGKTATIKIKGTKKKVKWSVSNGKVRIVKKNKNSVKIKGVGKGNCYLKAKVGKRTYKCKIRIAISSNSAKSTSKSGFNAKNAKKSMKIDKFYANNKLFLKIKSNYKYATDISAKCTFYNSEGKPVDYKNDSVSFLEKGRTCFLEFYLPSVKYSNYKIEYTYSEGLKWFYHSSVIKNLSLSKNYVGDEYNPYIMLQVSNSGNKECYFCEVAVVYYNKDNKVIDVNTETIGKISSGSSATEKSYIPYDRNTYENISYDHYEAFITYAYHLGK